jgi:concanavalin A-like lectin/glucanase superfamily protein
LHNYDPNTRRDQTSRLPFGYQPNISVSTNLTLNGAIHFHRQPSDTAASMQWTGGAHVLNGRGRVVFEPALFQNEFGGAGATVTIGPDITVEANGVTFGSRARFPVFVAPFINNLGTILADRPGTRVQFNAFGFTNSGTIRIGSALQITNNYGFVQTAAGKLVIVAAGTQPGVSHGQLRSASTVMLDGSFVLEAAPGFVAAPGDAFELLTYQERQGMFASIGAPPPPQSLNWTPEYGAASFRLRLGLPQPLPQSANSRDPSGALHFDGADDYVEVPHAAAFNAFPLTIMMWVRANRSATFAEGIASKYANGSLNGWTVFTYQGRIHFYYFRDGANYIWDEGLGVDGGFIADDQWHHVAVAIDGTGATFYLDGIKGGSLGWTGVPGPPSTTAPLQFGKYDQNQSLSEDLDEIILVGAALTEQEVNTYKARRVTAADDSRIIGLWRF